MTGTDTKTHILSSPTRVLLFFTLLFTGLYFAKPFLVPICLASLLAMLLVSLAGWLEKRGLNRGLSTLICVLAILLSIAAAFALLSFQLKGFAQDAPKIEGSVRNSIHKAQQYISNYIGMSPEKQAALVKQQSQSGGGDIGRIAMGITAGVFGIAGNFVLIIVYLFLFLYFRTHLFNFLLKAVPNDKKNTTRQIVDDSTTAIRQYLGGMAKMIVCLWIMYGIGFSIAGVKFAIFFAILCGLLEIVPFVGNLTGTALTALVALTQGNTMVVVGVLITYAVVQFIQTYFLEPLVVGKGVNINPVFTILIIVLGELVWGIAGMVLFLPLLAIVKIVLDKIPALQPYGFLLGNDDDKKGKET